MIDHEPFAPGTRVRLLSTSHLVDLRSDTGWVVRPDEWDGYYIVRLDQPALYHNADGSTSELKEIAEAFDNMEAASADLTAFVNTAYANWAFDALADAPIDALQGVSKADADALQQAFGIRTIRQLAESKFVRAAQAITLLAGMQEPRDLPTRAS